MPTRSTQCSTVVTALLVTACGGRQGAVPDAAQPAASLFGLCNPSPVDTGRATRVAFGGYSVVIPRGFVRRGRAADVLLYESGQQQLGIVATNDPHLFATTGGRPTSQRTIETCGATIAGVPAEVALLSVHMPAELVGDLRAGGRFVVAARFRAAAHGRDLVVYVGAVDRRTVEANAGFLWTVRFERRATPPELRL